MKTLLRLLLKTQHQQNRSKQVQTEKGMTLVELLVGSIMAFLIITPMLAFVVDMLNTDRREQVKSNTEQDVQAAVDFIAQDLNQAIYIYDNNTINNAAADGTAGIRTQLPNPNGGTPILVFWKRQQIPNAVSVNTNPANRVLPKDCASTTCNDTYVRSLVAYYLVRETPPPNSIWCQPSGVNCPSRIERYEIREGVRNPGSANPVTQPYYNNNDANNGQQVSPAFNSNFNFSQPRLNVTTPTGFTDPIFMGQNPQVLVNYIDQTAVPASDPQECEKALGNPTATVPGQIAPVAILEPTLRVSDPANSFYACVDSARNLARVTIRGNSLRRLQADAPYNPKNPAFFPTASVQVQGRGALGQ